MTMGTNLAALKIRRIRRSDLADLMELVGQLVGRASSRDDARRRLDAVLKLKDHVVFVAEANDGRVVGWVHVLPFPHLGEEPSAELGGLVVAESHRGRGIGGLLMNAAEKWGVDKGYSMMRFSSRIERKRAHEFYAHRGYRVVKTSYIFAKNMAGGGSKAAGSL